MKIKVVEIFGQCYACGELNQADAKITDWEEITQEDFEALVFWVNKENDTYGGRRFAIIKQVDIVDIKVDVEDFLEEARTAKIAFEQRQKKYQEKIASRTRVKAARKEAKERAVLEKLKGKYETE